MTYKWRDYRKDYVAINFPDGSKMSLHCPQSEFFGVVHKWCAKNGHAQVKTAFTEDGFAHYQTWGLSTDDGLIYAGRINQALIDWRNEQRSEWPAEAKATCERNEVKLDELFSKLDALSEQVAQQEEDLRLSKLAVKNASSAAKTAEAVADEMRRRAKEVDPDRLRREMAAEFSKKTEQLLEENKRLSASLYEATSQVEKLSEDKRRLRAALNTSRSR